MKERERRGKRRNKGRMKIIPKGRGTSEREWQKEETTSYKINEGEKERQIYNKTWNKRKEPNWHVGEREKEKGKIKRMMEKGRNKAISEIK